MFLYRSLELLRLGLSQIVRYCYYKALSIKIKCGDRDRRDNSTQNEWYVSISILDYKKFTDGHIKPFGV